MRILAGDVGGTKTALAVYETQDSGEYRTLIERTYGSADYRSLSALLAQFLLEAPGPRVDVAVFSVAGPVRGGVCSTTNLPWVMSEIELSSELGVPVALINDFHAVALGVLNLPESERRVLQYGVPDPQGAFAVLGAGTGLGEAIGVHLGNAVRVLSSEGGHADFAARNPLEWRLWQYLSAQTGHVSVERVVSGMGLGSIYDFVVEDGLAPDDPETRRRFVHEQRGAVISDRAGVDPAAARTLSLFASAYGAEAGNLALKVLPTAGLYVAGGIAARLADQLDWAGFMEAFLHKGRMSELLRTIPVWLVLNINAGLVGARAHAALLWRQRTLHSS